MGFQMIANCFVPIEYLLFRWRCARKKCNSLPVDATLKVASDELVLWLTHGRASVLRRSVKRVYNEKHFGVNGIASDRELAKIVRFLRRGRLR